MKRHSAPLGIVLSAMLLASPALAERSADTLAPARSLSGALLAADSARATNDFDAAVKYYRDALSFDPENPDIQKELLIAFVMDGQFADAVPIAEKLKTSSDVESIARLVLGVENIRDEKYLEAESMLILTVESDLERMLTGIMRAWTKYGAGEVDAALAQIDDLSGPDWFELFKSYHGAMIAAAAGRTEDAGKRFEIGVNNTAGGSASPQTYLRMAEAYAGFLARNGKGDEARAIIDRALSTAPANPTLLDLAAMDDAGIADRALDIETAAAGAGEILFDTGVAINRDGAETFAALYLQMARQLVPESDNVVFELAGISERIDAPQRAIEYYSEIPDDSPLKSIARLQTGLNLSDMDREEEAKKALSDVIEQRPGEYRAYLALGGVHASLKEYDEAAEVYEKAIDNLQTEAANYWPLYYRLGIAYERTKQWPKAEAAFRKALELSPDQPDVLNYLGYSFIDMNMNLDEGLEMIRKAVDMRPRDGYIIDSLGWAYYRLGQFEEAVVELDKAAELLPRDPTINDHLGDAYWRVGRKLEATYQWAQVLDMDGIEPDAAAEVRKKLQASNTAGEAPEIAESKLDDETNGHAAATPEEPEDG